MDLLNLIDSSSESEDDKTDSKRQQENPDSERENGRRRIETSLVKGKRAKQASITIVPANKASPSLFKRSIPHRQGHWAGHVMIPVKSFSPSFIRRSIQQFQRRLEIHGYSGIVVEHDEIHISLSKHFSLQNSNLESFARQLKSLLEKERPTKLFVDTSGNILVNDEGTRSFWGWSVLPNSDLRRILSHVDSVLKKYNQPPYYENPIFHISLASMAEELAHLNRSTAEESDQNDSDSSDSSDDNEVYTNDNTIVVDRIVCKFGNKKTFEIML